MTSRGARCACILEFKISTSCLQTICQRSKHRACCGTAELHAASLPVENINSPQQPNTKSPQNPNTKLPEKAYSKAHMHSNQDRSVLELSQTSMYWTRLRGPAAYALVSCAAITPCPCLTSRTVYVTCQSWYAS